MTAAPEGQHFARTDVPWRPGSWEPARYRLYDSIAPTIILAVAGIVRGFDDLGTSSEDSPALTVVEAAFPLRVWSLACTVPVDLLSIAIL